MSIGGYFELELSQGEEYHKNAIRLNTGRNAFEYILRAKKYKKVYLPYYTCDVMLEPIHKLDLCYEFYHIDKSFRPIFNFTQIKKDEVFVYNNYFGICDEQTSEVSKQCENLIIDNSQAFFAKPINGVDTFYSPRKFFGVPDGAYLYTDTTLNIVLEKDVSYNRCLHLLGRLDTGASNHYKAFKQNSLALANEPIKQMSNLTQSLLKSIDYWSVAQKRRENFNYLNNVLNDNELEIILKENAVPMVLPYLIKNGDSLKQKLIEKKIFIASYWPNVLEVADKQCIEYYFSLNLNPIPIDQRYTTIEINKVYKNIK
jgi:hypothetical protein